MTERTVPILYRIGYINNGVEVTAENQEYHIHPIETEYQDLYLRRANLRGAHLEGSYYNSITRGLSDWQKEVMF
jgi:hypothetical protein